MRRQIALLVLLVTLLSCGDSTEPERLPRELLVIVNSTEQSVSLVPTDTAATPIKIQLPSGDATPVSLAVSGSRAVVPLGLAHAVAVLNLENASISRLVPLEQGSGATGVAFESDTVAWVANPGLNTVTRVSLETGDTASVTVGIYPTAVAVADERVWVLNANLVDFAPAGPSWMTVVDPALLTAVDSVPLTGLNAQFVEAGPDGMLYVVNAGEFGAANGSLSIVSPGIRAEVALVDSLGEFPGSATWVSAQRLIVASLSEGILEIDPSTRTLVRGPDSAVKPDGAGVAAVAVDAAGNMYALDITDCVSPGKVHVLSPADLSPVRDIEVGLCPFAVEVAVLPVVTLR